MLRLRLLIKRHPLVYKLAKRLRDPNAHERLCSKDTDLCLEGYPSSANSFTRCLLLHLDPRLNIASHCHSIANIKIALKYGIPTVILIRNPKDVISSRMARLHPELDDDVPTSKVLDEKMLMYIAFYEFVLKNIDKLLVLSFEEVVKDTEKSVSKISEAARIRFNYDDLDIVKSRVFAAMEDWTMNHSDSERIALPTKRRESKKEKLKGKVEAAKYYEKTSAIYQNIMARLG